MYNIINRGYHFIILDFKHFISRDSRVSIIDNHLRYDFMTTE